jgi:LacI family transcriptional regulator
VARATMSEVAEAAGVSMKSVSRVINNEPNVSDKLRAKVLAAIKKLDYVPDFAARSLAGVRSFTIGILFNDYGDGFIPSYYPKLQDGAYRACLANGYHLLVETLASESPDFAAQFRQALNTMRTDGFVLAPPFSDNEVVMELLETRGIPYARIAPAGDFDRSPYVAIDDRAAASEMAEHLWALGHRRLGFAAGHHDHHAAHARRQGFAETLARLGCPDFAEAAAEFQFEMGIDAAKQLMALPEPPTAIFAANDDSAAGVMAGLAQLGLTVPDDVSVAGFDDSWIAQSVWPYLTTVHQPIAEMAHVAASMLILKNGQLDQAELPAIETRLVVRGSTAPPKSS